MKIEFKNEKDSANCAALIDGNIKIANIPEYSPEGRKVTRVLCVENKTSLKSVIIPDTVTEIDDRAFANCFNLENVILPSNIKKIGEKAFGCCKSIKEIIFPDSLQEIGWGAFLGCDELTEIKLPENLIILEDYSFYDCKKLTRIILSKNLQRIGDHAYSGDYIDYDYDRGSAKLIKVMKYNRYKNGIYLGTLENPYYLLVSCGSKLHKDCKIIGPQAYKDTTETVIKIPEGVVTISKEAFAFCDNLQKIELPSSLQIIEYGAFKDSLNLTQIIFKNKSFKYIDPLVFMGTKLTKSQIVFEEEIKKNLENILTRLSLSTMALEQLAINLNVDDIQKIGGFKRLLYLSQQLIYSKEIDEDKKEFMIALCNTISTLNSINQCTGIIKHVKEL